MKIKTDEIGGVASVTVFNGRRVALHSTGHKNREKAQAYAVAWILGKVVGK